MLDEKEKFLRSLEGLSEEEGIIKMKEHHYFPHCHWRENVPIIAELDDRKNRILYFVKNKVITKALNL
jgi:hypothetical protein